MNHSQPGFRFTVAERAHYAEKVDRLLSTLSDGKWYRSRELQRILHTDERSIRKYADLASGAVISSDKGYRLLRHASNDEIDHAAGRLISQAKRMLERAAQYQKARHTGGRAA